eukprot:scaffold700_cov22-Tisochrysis_lutea.AAC.2
MRLYYEVCHMGHVALRLMGLSKEMLESFRRTVVGKATSLPGIKMGHIALRGGAKEESPHSNQALMPLMAGSGSSTDILLPGVPGATSPVKGRPASRTFCPHWNKLAHPVSANGVHCDIQVARQHSTTHALTMKLK